MIRYIDADKLRKDEIARCHCVPCVGSNDNNYKDLDEVLNDAPTADVVEIVRCKDCEYCHMSTDPKTNISVQVCGYVGYNPMQSSQVTDNDYCSHGERREENEG